MEKAGSEGTQYMGGDCSGKEGEQWGQLSTLDGCGMQTSGKSLRSGSQEGKEGRY